MNKNNFKIQFIGIGAQKSGTSWLDACLREHPDICMGRREDGEPVKEIRFFDTHYERGMEWYASHFKHCTPELVKGEVTPRYMFTAKKSAERMSTHFSDAKLIVCLRNPIERAYSQYIYGKNMWAGETFLEAIKHNPEIIERGYYAKQIKHFSKYFPREQIYIGIYEDLEKAPLSFIQDIYAFLGVKTNYTPHAISQKYNTSQDIRFKSRLLEKMRQCGRRFLAGRTAVKKLLKLLHVRSLEMKLQRLNTEKQSINKKPEMSSDDRDFLRDAYISDIHELEKLIGRDLSFWK